MKVFEISIEDTEDEYLGYLDISLPIDERYVEYYNDIFCYQMTAFDTFFKTDILKDKVIDIKFYNDLALYLNTLNKKDYLDTFHKLMCVVELMSDGNFRIDKTFTEFLSEVKQIQNCEYIDCRDADDFAIKIKELTIRKEDESLLEKSVFFISKKGYGALLYRGDGYNNGIFI